MPHDISCRRKAFNHSDAAKRVSDEYNLHKLADPYGCIGKWIAITLHDGSSDHTLYDRKQQAVQHQHHNEQWYAFIQIKPVTMSTCEAETYLTVMRRVYDAGLRMADPDNVTGGKEVIRRLTREDQRSQLQTIRTGGRSKPSNLTTNPNRN
jgi:hypothetical protein